MADAERLVELFEKASKISGKERKEFLDRVRDEDANLAHRRCPSTAAPFRRSKRSLRRIPVTQGRVWDSGKGPKARSFPNGAPSAPPWSLSQF